MAERPRSKPTHRRHQGGSMRRRFSPRVSWTGMRADHVASVGPTRHVLPEPRATDDASPPHVSSSRCSSACRAVTMASRGPRARSREDPDSKTTTIPSSTPQTPRNRVRPAGSPASSAPRTATARWSGHRSGRDRWLADHHRDRRRRRLPPRRPPGGHPHHHGREGFVPDHLRGAHRGPRHRGVPPRRSASRVTSISPCSRGTSTCRGRPRRHGA